VHSLIHTEYAKAAAQHGGPTRAVVRGRKWGHPPPNRARVAVARGLAIVASRVDRESARRAVA
jgi:hypothetical protein